MPKKELTLEAINDRLKHTGVAVERRGNRLGFRATLPSKTGRGNRQQRISLGVGATEMGLEYAEAKAWELAAQLAQRRFRWEDWNHKREQLAERSAAEWIEAYRCHLETTEKIKRDGSWRRYYWQFFKFIEPSQTLTDGAILAAALRYEANSRQRRVACDKLRGLAEFAGVEIDFDSYEGNYSPSRTKERKIPTDAAIAHAWTVFVEGRAKVEGYRWQWAYGVMAAYGLRPHEIFFCEIEAEPPYCCRVLKGKTGPRETYPLYPEWVETWRLWEMKVPQVRKGLEAYTYWGLGQKVCQAICRYIARLPVEQRFPPYNLRHAYALRGPVKMGVSDRTMAKHLGHSVDTFIRRYSRYLSKDSAREEYLERMQRSDRPKPPS